MKRFQGWICLFAIAEVRVFLAPRRVIYAHWREIGEGFHEGARGAAKGVSREIKSLYWGKVESLLGKVKVLTREVSSHRYD